jgi:hypothetical protein
MTTNSPGGSRTRNAIHRSNPVTAPRLCTGAGQAAFRCTSTTRLPAQADRKSGDIPASLGRSKSASSEFASDETGHYVVGTSRVADALAIVRRNGRETRDRGPAGYAPSTAMIRKQGSSEDNGVRPEIRQ